MEIITRIVKRKLGDIVIEGTMFKEGFKYWYDYPANREYEKNLFESDKQKIANKFGIAQEYVNAILKGKKFNEEVLLEAEKIGQYNVANGYCKKKG